METTTIIKQKSAGRRKIEILRLLACYISVEGYCICRGLVRYKDGSPRAMYRLLEGSNYRSVLLRWNKYRKKVAQLEEEAKKAREASIKQMEEFESIASLELSILPTEVVPSVEVLKEETEESKEEKGQSDEAHDREAMVRILLHLTLLYLSNG
ncbi:hypothetical protein ACH5RR_015190 [Cinchona calisaya]|uniref:Uncharacterized protein n=1 Tax=Cinchona calisaya TaxID=153742 RepID=A0ABD2ZU73_9GENT